MNLDEFCGTSSFLPIVNDDNAIKVVERTVEFVEEMIDTCDQTACDKIYDAVVKVEATLAILDDRFKQKVRRKIEDTEIVLKKFDYESNACLCKSLEAINQTISSLATKQTQNATTINNIDNRSNDNIVIVGGDTVNKTEEEFISDGENLGGQQSIYWSERECEFNYSGRLPGEIGYQEKYIESASGYVSASKRVKELNADKKAYVAKYKLICGEIEDVKPKDRNEKDKEKKANEPFPWHILAPIKDKDSNGSKKRDISVDWSSSDYCKQVSEWIKQNVTAPHYLLSKMGGFLDSDGTRTMPDWIKWIEENIPVFGKSAAAILLLIGGGATNIADILINSSLSGMGCDISPASGDITKYILLQLAQKWLGIDIPKIRETILRNIDTACPTMLPNVNEADDALLSKTIGLDEWRCIVRANNSIPERREPVVRGKRTRQSTYELLQLFLRDKINESELDEKLREIGWTNYSESELQKELAWLTPSPSDLIPWMLRDVFDPVVVKEFGLDDEFKAKYTAKAKEFYRAAGVSDDIARYHWMAHWVNPSNTALFEMYHRLRGGSKLTGIYRYFDKDGNKLATPIELTQDDIKVTEEQVARAIGVNDLAPHWRDKMLAISRPPLTRTDVRRAYEIDAMDEGEVYESFRDLGYSHDNATILLNFYIKQKERKNVRAKGRILPSRIAIMYEQFAITKDEALSLLQRAGLSIDDATATINTADIKIKANTRQKCLKELRKRYMYGDVEESQLSKSLSDIGLSQEQSIEYIKSVKCERSSRHKEATASQLCEWHGRGLISDKSYQTRLLRIGFLEADVARIMEACYIQAEEKRRSKKGYASAEEPIPEKGETIPKKKK